MGFAGAGGQVAIGGAVIGSTAGSVLFIDSLGQLAQDNAELFWDDTLNRLGIGTASPAALLEVTSSENSTIGILSVRSGILGGPAFEAHANGALSNFFQGRLGSDANFRVRLDVNGLALGDGASAPDVTLSRGSVPHAVIGNAALSPIDLEVLGIRSAAVGGLPILAATGSGAIPIQCGSVHGGIEYFFETGAPGARTEHASLIYNDSTFTLPGQQNPQIELVFATAPAFSMIMRNIEDASENNTDDELVFLKLAGAVTSTINQLLDPTGLRLDFAWTQNTTNWTATNERLVGLEVKLGMLGNADFSMGVAAALVPRIIKSGTGNVSNLAFIWADSSGPGAGNDLGGAGVVTNHYGALFDIITAIGEPANLAVNRFALWLRAGGATTINEAIHVEAGVVHFRDELVLDSFLNFSTKAIPSDPATEEARLYLKTVDGDNNALAVKVKQAASVTEVVLSEGLHAEDHGFAEHTNNLVASKTGTTIRTNTTTKTADPHISIAVVSGKKYYWILHINALCPVASVDLKMTMDSARGFGPMVVMGDYGGTAALGAGQTNIGSDLLLLLDNNSQHFMITGILTCNNTGAWALLWAQNTIDAVNGVSLFTSTMLKLIELD